MTDPAAVSARPAVRWGTTALLLGVMAALLVTSSLHKRLVYDEYDNLSYGYRFLTKGPGVAPLGQRMPVLVFNALGCLTNDCDPATLKRSEGARLAVRAAGMVLAIGLALLVSAWARRMFGPVAGLAALWLCVFDPTLLGHGKQVTSDVAVALFMTAAVYAYWRWSEQRTWASLAGCAFATAAAIASKFTGLLLVPILALLAIADLRARRSGPTPMPQATGRMLAAAAAFAVAVVVLLNAAYLFNGTFRTAASYQWQSESFRQHVTWPVPIPLPKVFVQGLDYSSYLQENPEKGRGFNYVLGALNRDGRWYAFPLMVLLKTPLAVFVLALLGLRGPGPRGMAALLWIPFGLVMLFFSLCVDPQIGIRYVLPAIPFLILAAARGAADLHGYRRRLVPALLVWQAVSTLSYHPHFIPYFNELIGRRVNAYKYLADSNLDWEDHGYDIARFQERHPEMHVVVDTTGAKPIAGWVLVGANDLVGIFMPDRFQYLRGLEPVRHVGYAHLLFYVPPDRVGTPPGASAPEQQGEQR